MDIAALTLTLRLAVCTTAILFVIGLPLAHWLVNTHWRGKVLVEAVVALPLVLPPTVVGFYLLLWTGPRSWFGATLAAWTGARLPFTFGGILLASVIYNLPFAARPFAAALASVDPRLVEAATCLGCSRLGAFRRVTLPLAWPGILAGLVLAFAHTIGEFGVVLMIGGNIPGVTRTLSIAIYDDVQALDYASAASAALPLVLFAFLTLAMVQLLQRRVPLV